MSSPSGQTEEQGGGGLIPSPPPPGFPPLRGRIPNSEALAVRILVCFAILCLVKVGILLEFQKHLHEVHWRVGSTPFSWVNVAAFCSFTLLTGCNLWGLGGRCRKLGVPAVRWANGMILLLGALFILLRFHEGRNNYLTPVLEGVLSWTDLRWNLACDFFFRMPFLSVWIFLYAGIYYVLVRRKKEGWILQVTALFAVAYLGSCLRELMEHRDALVILSCFGVAGLAGSGDGTRPVGWKWMLLFPGGAALFFLVMFGLEAAWDWRRMDAEFLMLTGGSLVVIGGVSVMAWRRGFFPAWSWMLPFVSAAFVLLLNANFPLAPNYHNLLCGALMFPRYFVGELGLATVLFLAGWVFQKWRPAGSLRWLDVLGLGLVAFALADWRLAQVMAARLDWQALSLAFGETPKMMWRMARPYLPALTAVFLLLTAIYYAAVRLASAWVFKRNPSSGASANRNGMVFFWLGFILLGGTGAWLFKADKAGGQSALLLAETSPLWMRTSNPLMDAGTFEARARALGIQFLNPAPSAPPAARRDLNVVLIFQESSFNRHLSLFGGTNQTQPLLSQYKNRMEIFTNFYSNFAGSIHARFATFAGLYPVRDFQAFTFRPVPVKSLFTLLHEQDYACSLFYSSFFDYTGFRDFLRGSRLDEAYDADTMPGARKDRAVSWGLREEETLRSIQGKISEYATNRHKFFLTYIPAAPHYPFDGVPERFRVFQRQKVGDFTPAFLNELLYMDWIITSIIDQLKTTGLLENTLVVITSDHGELLGQDGGPIGHGWAVNPELANIPLIIMDPAATGYRVNPVVGSQVDLLPTLLDRLGLPLPERQLYQGDSLFSARAQAGRSLYLNSFQEYGIIRGRTFHSGDRNGGGTGQRGAAVILGSTDVPSGEAHAGAELPPISAFDQFQENFLLHYAEYSARAGAGLAPAK